MHQLSKIHDEIMKTKKTFVFIIFILKKKNSSSLYSEINFEERGVELPC